MVRLPRGLAGRPAALALALIVPACSDDPGLTKDRLIALVVTPEQATAPLGRSVRFTATGTYETPDRALRDQDVTGNVSWSPPALFPDATTPGAARGLELGEVTIAATLDLLRATAALSTTRAEIAELVLSPATSTITATFTVQLTARATYTDGTVSDVVQVDFTAFPETVCTVNAGGLVTAVAPGRCGITARAPDSGVTGSATVTVVDAHLERIFVSPATPRIRVGATVALEAIGVLSDGRQLPLASRVFWRSSDASIAGVGSSSGLVTGVTAGEATLTACDTLDPAVCGSATATIVDPVLLSCEVLPADPNVPLGLDVELRAVAIFDDSAGPEDVTAETEWQREDPAILAYTPPASFRGLAEGCTTVTAVLRAANRACGEARVCVVSPVPVRLRIEPNPIVLTTDDEVQLSAIADLSSGERDVDVTAHPSLFFDPGSSPAALAVVSSSGLLTALSVGTGSVSATYSAPGQPVLVASALLEVEPPIVISLRVDPPQPYIPAGTLRALTCWGMRADGSERRVRGATWSVADTAIATVDAATGVAGGVQRGETTISCHDGGLSASTSLRIVERCESPELEGTFQAGIGAWSVEQGDWEVGQGSECPTSGACAATDLGGNYTCTQSNLVSRPITLCTPPMGAPIDLRWNQAYDLNRASGTVDLCIVDQNGNCPTLGWDTLPGTLVQGASGGILPGEADLSAYAGETVRIRFHFYPNAGCVPAPGWAVDDVAAYY